MSQGRSGLAAGQIGPLIDRGSLVGLGEAGLVDRFVRHRDGEAFEALMARHGPMVLGVCRRLLSDRRDVEDAFQATFLILVRKAGTLRDRDRVAPWLHGVARRVAVRARANAARRRSRERPAGGDAADPGGEGPGDGGADLRAVLDDELARLPDRLRAAVVLCDLEGLPQDEAARRLGCPVGTVKSRLSRARDRLRHRLVRRGVVPAALAGGAWLQPGPASALAVPAALGAATLRAAGRLASGAPISTPVRVLVSGTLGAMIMTKVRMAAAAVLALGLVAGGAWTVAARPQPAPPAPQAAATPTPKPPAPTPPAEPGRTRALDLTVIGRADRRPVAGAMVEASAFNERVSPPGLATDADGRCRVEVPADVLGSFQVGAFRDGYVPLARIWTRAELDAGGDLAATLELEPGTPVGSMVRDDAGRPIRGVRVFPWLVEDRFDPLRPFFTPEAGLASTDAGGRWRAAIAPAAGSGRLLVRLSHPDYVCDSPVGYTRSLTLAEARAGDGVMVMKPGFAVAGRVVDPDGRPVAGAAVSVPFSATAGDGFRTATDGDGRFRFPHVSDRAGRGVISVQVEAAGFAPAMASADPVNDGPPVEVRLARGRRLAGLVVDAQGRPIPGAGVSVNAAGPCRNLRWRAATDADGRFAWPDAPASGVPDVLLDVRKDGYADAFQRRVALADAEAVVELNRPLRVRGSVVDADTGRPIDAFQLVIQEGTRDRIEPTGWLNAHSWPGRQGSYSYVPSTGRDKARQIRIHALGYREAVSRVIAAGEGDVVVDFRLEPAPARPVAGVVLRADRTPLADAVIHLATPEDRLSLLNGEVIIDPTGGPATRRTGPDGRFAFPGPGERAAVVVVHAEGFARRRAEQLAAAPELVLEPWGRVEGTVRVGGKPAAGQAVRLANPRAIGLEIENQFWEATAAADAEGRFAFGRVMPGQGVAVERPIPWRLGPLVADRTEDFAVAPGATARVELGREGRPVVGRVVVPAGVAGLADFSYARGVIHPRPKPEQVQLAGRSRGFKVMVDGRFRVDDLPPGDYGLAVESLAPDSPYPAVASARLEFTVAEAPAGRAGEPHDVGAVRLTPKPAAAARAELGRTLALRVVGRADGKPVAGAVVEFDIDRGPRSAPGLVTDAEGRCSLPISDGMPGRLRVGAFRDGFVPRARAWGADEVDAMAAPAVTLELDPGEPAGGLVRDEHGRPIAGARVIPRLDEDRPEPGRMAFAPESGVATTDAKGRWRASFLPAGAKGSLLIRLVHPDYASDGLFPVHGLTLDEARAQASVLEMTPGFAVAGSVADEAGRPVPGALVTLPYSDAEGDGLRATSDAEGRFRFEHVVASERIGRRLLAVQAEAAGFTPAASMFAPGPDQPPVAIRLARARPLTVRVVDAGGGPVPGAAVSVDAWGDCRSLAWRAETDADGRFTWPDAPAGGEVSFRVDQPGSAEAVRRRVAATDPDPTILLKRPTRPRGATAGAGAARPNDAPWGPFGDL